MPHALDEAQLDKFRRSSNKNTRREVREVQRLRRIGLVQDDDDHHQKRSYHQHCIALRARPAIHLLDQHKRIERTTFEQQEKSALVFVHFVGCCSSVFTSFAMKLTGVHLCQIQRVTQPCCVCAVLLFIDRQDTLSSSEVHLRESVKAAYLGG
jgi:hypothetical protein